MSCFCEMFTPMQHDNEQMPPRTSKDTKLSKDTETHPILIVEDEPATRQLLAGVLKSAGYRIAMCESVRSAEALLNAYQPMALILDLSLEDGDGYEILKLAIPRGIATIVVSARQDLADRLISFELGADDFMIKPVSERELIARLKRSLRRYEHRDRSVQHKVHYDDIQIDLFSRSVTYRDGKSKAFTPGEFKLLTWLMDREGVLIKRDEISREVIGSEYDIYSRSTDVLVSKLRKKIDPTGRLKILMSIRGEGYIFKIP
jgi:DNA-binding response OmpR family regulator